MEDKVLNEILKCFENSFYNVYKKMMDENIALCDETEIRDKDTYTIIIGFVGKISGRVLFTTDSNMAKFITKNMSGEEDNDPVDTYVCLSEFANMFCGNAVTEINKKFSYNIRLTTPAIIWGKFIRINTPNILNGSIAFTNEEGIVVLDVGYEEANK